MLDSLALWQSFLASSGLLYFSAGNKKSRLVITILIVPLSFPASIIFAFPIKSVCPLHTLVHLPPFASTDSFGYLYPITITDAMSPRFCPPHCYQLSLAEDYSLLRTHLPPALLHPSLVLPLVRIYLISRIVQVPPQVSLPARM